MAPFRHAFPAILLIAACGLPAGASARETIGVYEAWGAFRDARPPHCFAITEPVRRAKNGARPFVAVGDWPERGVRGQLNVRLRMTKRRGSPVYLHIGERRFLLASGGAEAWAPDAATDAAIVAAMRSAPSMTVAAIDPAGRPFADGYRLRGAATAIDAAALACVGAG